MGICTSAKGSDSPVDRIDQPARITAGRRVASFPGDGFALNVFVSGGIGRFHSPAAKLSRRESVSAEYCLTSGTRAGLSPPFPLQHSREE